MQQVVNIVFEVLGHTWFVLAEAAPWLVLGLFAAGLAKWALPEARLVKLMGRSAGTQVMRATLVGAPLPLCSCGVLPAALGLRRQGLSKAGTSSFLVATPQNGVDSIALSYALLGPVFTVVRVATSLVSALASGAATLVIDRGGPAPAHAGREAGGSCAATGAPTCGCASSASEPEPEPEPEPAASCCSPGRTVSLGVMNEPEPAAFVPEAANAQAGASCCSSSGARAGSGGGETFVSGQRYAFGRFLMDIGGWLAVGLLIAGAMNAFVGPDGLAAYGSGLLAMGAVLVISVPMYICASASTPVAASMLLAGVSPGVVLVFLLAGPATNMAGLALIKKELGFRATAGYLGGLIVSCVTLGLLADWLMLSVFSWEPIDAGPGGAHLLPVWLSNSAAFALLIWFGGLNVAKLTGDVRARRGSSAGPHAREGGAVGNTDDCCAHEGAGARTEAAHA
jgi:uncharacterized membrane protein YraQ (UPF0718 family)